jgi:hypothetical protein
MSHTTIRMTRCSVGRATQKYTSSAGGSLTLQDVLENGNVATIGIQTLNPIISNTLTLTGVSKGDILYAPQDGVIQTLSIGPSNNVLTVTNQTLGTLSWEPPQGAGGASDNLENTTLAGAFTNQTILFQNPTTGFTVSSNAVVTGNVTADHFIGDGSNLTGISSISTVSQIQTDMTSNASRISDLEAANTVQETLINDLTSDLGSNVARIASLESNALMTSSSTLGTIQQGDLLYGAGTNSLSKLSIGSSGTVLTVDNTGIPSWQSGGGGSLWNQDGGKLYYTGGPVGIANTEPLTTQTLQVGSNVVIEDVEDDKMTITGNVYVSRALRAIDLLESYEVRANFFTVKNIDIRAERPRRGAII